ncbi:DEAD/DEAH box helicase family protein [Archangium gephyra]|uniref:DEAD/DEAH box helicase family protein n=1 Tax=Archangium gephyra TaxID=48 RepID=UPI003B7A167D
MSAFDLLPFQVRASDQIAQRFLLLRDDPRRPTVHRNWDVPFYQALSALTGAGKTPILADAIAQIRAAVSVEPLVLWISKSRAVVEQTFGNFEPGGKYEGLIEGFQVENLLGLTPDRIADTSVPRLALATVGSFNQKDRADGTLRVHKIEQDRANDSLWDLLRDRKNSFGQRRPLFVVYDEGHNLSDQQSELLLELEPDVILVASATMKTPARIARLVERLREHGWSNELQNPEDEVRPSLITAVNTREVVESGLVKRQLVLGGYSALMESVLDDMLVQMADTAAKAETLGAGFTPKAIYVCRTNISQDDGASDNPSRPFKDRRAPPILIWRYLTEQKGIDPSTIAVYCDLKFERRDHPPPSDFVLFSGGEEDFASFRAGNFQHIIFNLSLQEGWDDPSCCFAYIDKSMGSGLQIEQVIGRVLRQPGARHYPDPELNTANFYIRVDDKQEFPKILETVRRKIAAELPEIRLDSYAGAGDRQRMRLLPKDVLHVPEIHIDSDGAAEPLDSAVRMLNDYRRDTINTAGKGEHLRAVQLIGHGAKAEVSSKETPHSNRVMARWIMRRAVQALFPEVVKTIDWSDGRFDARVEVTSSAAANLRAEAERLVQIYLDNSDLAFEEENLYQVAPVLVNPAKMERFENSLHEGYSDLNADELAFARALDNVGLSWVRNPANGGFSIPLLEKGEVRNFFPDFLVWRADVVFALDPKGEHLIHRDACLKLMDIRDEKGARKVVVRLITPGKWQEETRKKLGSTGMTVWSLGKGGKIRARHCETLTAAVEVCLKL